MKRVLLIGIGLFWAIPAFGQPIPKRQKIDFSKTPIALEIEVQKELDAATRALSNRKEDQAREHFDQAIGLAPERAETYYLIGEIYARRTMAAHGNTIAPRYEEAAQWWELYLDLVDDPAAPHWADVHLALGKVAISKYLEDSERRQYRLAYLETAEYHLLRAYEAYRDAFRVEMLYDVELDLALIAERHQRYEEALRYLLAAESRLASSNLNQVISVRRAIFNNLVWLGRHEEAFDAALATYERIVLENNHNIYEYIDVTLMMSTAHLRLENFEESLRFSALAESVIQPDLSASGSSNPLLAMLKSHNANIYFEMGDWEMAERLYREALNTYAEPTYKNNLAWAIVVRSEVGDPRLEEALMLSESAVEMSPSAANLDTLAEVYARLERYDEALELIEEALLITSNDPTLHPYLLRQRKRLREARSGFVPLEPPIARLKLWLPP